MLQLKASRCPRLVHQSTSSPPLFSLLESKQLLLILSSIPRHQVLQVIFKTRLPFEHRERCVQLSLLVEPLRRCSSLLVEQIPRRASSTRPRLCIVYSFGQNLKTTSRSIFRKSGHQKRCVGRVTVVASL